MTTQLTREEKILSTVIPITPSQLFKLECILTEKQPIKYNKMLKLKIIVIDPIKKRYYIECNLLLFVIVILFFYNKTQS